LHDGNGTLRTRLKALGYHALHAVGANQVSRVQDQRFSAARPSRKYAESPRSHFDSSRGSAQHQFGARLLCTMREHWQNASTFDDQIWHLQPDISLGSAGDHTHHARAMQYGFIGLKTENAMQVGRDDPGPLELVERTFALQNKHSLAALGQKLGRAQPRTGAAHDDHVVPAPPRLGNVSSWIQLSIWLHDPPIARVC